MAILDHPAAQARLDEAVLTVEQVQDLGPQLQTFLQRYLPLFQRVEQRRNAHALLEGKLSSLDRKTCEPIAHLLGLRREVLQDFVGTSPWDDDRLLAALRAHVTEVWADPHAVLTGDSSGFPKKGEHSCGVKRQYCGRLGKIDNCQIGVFLGYAGRHGQVLLDHQVFLPPEWADDPDRRAEAGIPEEVVYQEEWEILLGLLDASRAVPHAWFTADSEFGRVNAFRAGLRQRQERYVVDVRADLRMRDRRAPAPARKGDTGRVPSVPPVTNASDWAAGQADAAWQRFEIRDGEKGVLRVEAVETWVDTFEDNTRVGPEERLVVIRTRAVEPAKTWYTLSNAAAPVPLAEVVWGHGQRHWHEATFKEGKSEIGMDEYETRTWRGWHHHMTLSLLALWFLALQQHQVEKKRPRLR